MQDAQQYIEKGAASTIVDEVTTGNTASSCGSGQIDVYATPFMIAAMERAAVSAVDHQLPDGWITVGISVDIQHLAATPVGGEVEVLARLTEVDGKRLVFAVRAEDNEEEVGRGTHQRYCVHRESFVRQVEDKVCRRGEN